jgi:hypothetical protein
MKNSLSTNTKFNTDKAFFISFTGIDGFTDLFSRPLVLIAEGVGKG